MPTPEQMKGIALRTAGVVAVDKFGFNAGVNMKQAGFDAVNLALTEYGTRPQVEKLTANMMQTVDPMMREQVLNVVLSVVQDMALSRFAGSKSRSFTESLVVFGVSEVVAHQLQMRFPAFA